MRAIYERALGTVAIGLVVTGAVFAMTVGAAAAAQDNILSSSSGKCHVSSLCFNNDKDAGDDTSRSNNEGGNAGPSANSGGSGTGGGKTNEPGANGSGPTNPAEPKGI